MDIIKKIKIDIPDIKQFVDETFKLPVQAELRQGRAQVAAASLMGVFTLNLSKPLEFIVPGFDNEKLIDERFGRWYVKEEEKIKNKIGKHADFVVYINTNNNGGLTAEEIILKTKALFSDKKLQFIDLSGSLEPTRILNNMNSEIMEWINNCEAVLCYIDGPFFYNSANFYISGLCAAYRKPMISLNSMYHCCKDANYIENPWLYDPFNSDIDKTGTIQIEMERKFLISEDLFYRVKDLAEGKYKDSDNVWIRHIIQILDDDMIRYREISDVNDKMKPIVKDENHPPMYVKEIKSKINFDWIPKTNASIKLETAIPISFKQYLIKLKEFKHLHDYERPIKKTRISIWNESVPNMGYSIEFNQIKISDHVMYMAEIEMISKFHGIDAIDMSSMVVVNMINFLNNLNPYEICNYFTINVKDGEFYEIMTEDNINNPRLMSFIMDHTDKSNYLEFIDFMKYCNEKCPGCIVKNHKSPYCE